MMCYIRTYLCTQGTGKGRVVVRRSYLRDSGAGRSCLLLQCTCHVAGLLFFELFTLEILWRLVL